MPFFHCGGGLSFILYLVLKNRVWYNAPMKEKKIYLDLLRILAILMVFHLHFTVAAEQPYGVFFGFANGNWGNVGTSLFFLISGNCLARNYGEKLNIGQFYKKRWLAIYPMFYVCYLLVLFGHTVILRNHPGRVGFVPPGRFPGIQ